MILYTVFYRKLGTKRWNKIQNVKGDGILSETNVNRFFILEDDSRCEIPCLDVEFKFSKERYLGIVERMDNEAGQDVKVNKR